MSSCDRPSRCSCGRRVKGENWESCPDCRANLLHMGVSRDHLKGEGAGSVYCRKCGMKINYLLGRKQKCPRCGTPFESQLEPVLPKGKQMIDTSCSSPPPTGDESDGRPGCHRRGLHQIRAGIH